MNQLYFEHHLKPHLTVQIHMHIFEQKCLWTWIKYFISTSTWIILNAKIFPPMTLWITIQNLKNNINSQVILMTKIKKYQLHYQYQFYAKCLLVSLLEIMILFDIISYFSTNSIKTLTLTPDFYIVVFSFLISVDRSQRDSIPKIFFTRPPNPFFLFLAGPVPLRPVWLAH